MIMISATASARWCFAPLFLALFLAQLLAHPTCLLVTGVLALMASSAGNVTCFFASVSSLLVALAEGLSTINTVLVLMMCLSPFWYYLTLGTAVNSEPPSAGSQRHSTANTTPTEIPESAPSFRDQNWTRSTFSKGGASPSTPRTTPPRTPGTASSTSSAANSDATWNYGDSLRGHGARHGYGYGQWRVPPITHTSLHSGNLWTTPVRKGGSLDSSIPCTRTYLALKQASVTVHSAPIPTSLEPVYFPPAPPPQLPSPTPTPVALHLPAEAKARPAVAPKKLGRISQKERPPTRFRCQRSARRVARQSRRTPLSCPPLPHTPSVDPSIQDAGSPMIVEFEDEPPMLADPREILSITSPRFPCTEKFEDVPFAPLVKMASPIIGHHPRDGGLASYFHDFSMDIDSDSDSSDDDSMDVDPHPLEAADIDMDTWDHPPVETPRLGYSYAPSLRYQFSGLYLEDDDNMVVYAH